MKLQPLALLAMGIGGVLGCGGGDSGGFSTGLPAGKKLGDLSTAEQRPSAPTKLPP